MFQQGYRQKHYCNVRETSKLSPTMLATRKTPGPAGDSDMFIGSILCASRSQVMLSALRIKNRARQFSPQSAPVCECLTYYDLTEAFLLERLWQYAHYLHRIDLTRFNKICHPSKRPRWQVDKEAIGLSRVQQCSSTYNPPS